ncbi:MAG TPA: EamA family transporter [Candidatus Limnocylindrales bacterium]|nr:EamA family transporter [Candidatus Limnocylindrales bacterium]
MARGRALIGPGAFFGLASAFSWGIGDFCGGLVSRWSSVLSAMLVSQGLGFAAMAAILGIVGEPAPTQDAVIWASLAGVSGVVGLWFFYFALARGTMGVVAPLAALVGAGVPVLVAVANGEQLSPGRLLGIGLALLAVILISVPGPVSSDGERRSRRADLADMPYAVISGLGFAGFFIFVDIASANGATWWPLTIVRAAGLALVAVAIIWATARAKGADLPARLRFTLGVDRMRAHGRGLTALLPLLLLTGIGDVGGNVFFLLASHSDALSVAVVLASLYPVVTTLLAVLILRERLSRIQLLGVILAMASVPLLR